MSDDSAPPPSPPPPLPAPSLPLHNAAALLPSTPPPQSPLFTHHPGAESEVPTLHGPALDAARPPPPAATLCPSLDVRNSGGRGDTAVEHHLDFLPPGYRFNPQDDELITHYLGNKIADQPLPPNKINDVRLYDHNPEYLAAKYPQWTENEWFFFTPRERKYPNGDRPNRAAGDGYWKATGSDKPITCNRDIRVGVKKALVFHRGKPPKGYKTNWIMHEYRIEDANIHRHDGTMKLDDWVLCSIHESTEESYRRSRRSRLGAKPHSTSSCNRRGRKPKPSSTTSRCSHREAALAYSQLGTSSDGGLILQGLNCAPLIEDNQNARLNLAAYFHATTPYPYCRPNSYHEPFMGNDLVHGNNEKLKGNIGCLRESPFPGSDVPPWTTDCPWMPELPLVNDHRCTSGDECFIVPSSERNQLMLEENTWHFDCLESFRDLIPDVDATDAPSNPSDDNRSNPLGFATNTMDSTKLKMDAIGASPSAVHEAGAVREAGSIPMTDAAPIQGTCSPQEWRNLGDLWCSN